MHHGKVEAEVGLFVTVNTWKTLRWYFTESELVYLGWDKAKVPIVALEPENLWESDPKAPEYYRGRHRDLPPELAAVVQKPQR